MRGWRGDLRVVFLAGAGEVSVEWASIFGLLPEEELVSSTVVPCLAAVLSG